MKIETTRFGEIEVAEDRTFDFPEGIPGFPQIKQYALIDQPGSPAFQWLQAVEEPSLAFVLTDPIFFKPDYKILVHGADLTTIQVEKIEDARVLVILTIPAGQPEQMTANLQGPLVFNVGQRLARQVVLTGNQYPVKYPVFAESSPESAGTSVSQSG